MARRSLDSRLQPFVLPLFSLSSTALGEDKAFNKRVLDALLESFDFASEGPGKPARGSNDARDVVDGDGQ